MILPDEKVAIVGAGCFGVSTAYHLLKRGFTNISIIERSKILPAKDAASNDMNRSLSFLITVQTHAFIDRNKIQSFVPPIPTNFTPSLAKKPSAPGKTGKNGATLIMSKKRSIKIRLLRFLLIFFLSPFYLAYQDPVW